MSLETEIESKRQHIRTDAYQMSIGEFANLYRDKEVVISPEYQRLFRWKIERQSRLIESLLLGIPIPSIFVAEREDGIWEVVDGLQRLSTIFQFMGVLRDQATGQTQPASTLVGTKYLPSLEGMAFDEDSAPAGATKFLDTSSRISFKRAKIDVKILKQDTNPSIKFELFDRLNSGGEPPSDQEVRTAQMLMVKPDFQDWLGTLRSDENFQSCLPLTSRQYDEQYDLELVLRFLVLLYSERSILSSFSEFESLLTDQALALAVSDPSRVRQEFSMSEAGSVFQRTFRLLADSGVDVFRRYDGAKQRYQGGFSVSAFEVVATGVATHIDAWDQLGDPEARNKLDEKCRALWQNPDFRSGSGAGLRASQRVPRTSELGPRVFALT